MMGLSGILEEWGDIHVLCQQTTSVLSHTEIECESKCLCMFHSLLFITTFITQTEEWSRW